MLGDNAFVRKVVKLLAEAGSDFSLQDSVAALKAFINSVVFVFKYVL
jgi:hypothetical protein